MSSILCGFADGDAWMRAADGRIVGRARDRSYKEVARDGMPIETLVADVCTPPVESCIVSDLMAAAGAGCPVGLSETDPVWNFEYYFDAAEPRSVARARRTGGTAKKPVKLPKYGPKATKLRTVAAAVTDVESAPVRHSAPVCICGLVQDIGNYTDNSIRFTHTCHHCLPEFANAVVSLKDAIVEREMCDRLAWEEERREWRMADRTYY